MIDLHVLNYAFVKYITNSKYSEWIFPVYYIEYSIYVYNIHSSRMFNTKSNIIYINTINRLLKCGDSILHCQ